MFDWFKRRDIEDAPILKTNNFLDIATPHQRYWFGIFMWAAFYVGYFTFCLNWIIFSNLEGSESGSGWLSFFKDHGLGKGDAAGVRKDAVNYSITLARGMATISVAWVMTKLSHKKASILAFALNTAALPLIFSPHYALLVLGRMLMATGGTMLIILIQPVISRFFGLKLKGILSTATATSYILAALIANLIFVYEGANQSVINALLRNWKLVTGLCAGLSYLPLIAYIFFGRNFTTSDNPEEELQQKELPQNTYTGIIKEKSTWFWAFFYSFLLVASLLVSLKVPKILEQINGDLVTQTTNSVNVNWSKLYVCFFYAGCLAGMCWGRWAKTKYQRKPILALGCAMSLIFWLSIFGAAHITNNKPLATTIIYWSAFFFSFFAMGMQAVILYIPHEYKENNNAKRITIFFAYLWGIGYIIFTVYQIIFMSCLDMQNKQTGAYVAAGLITFFVFMYAVCSLTIKEPRPDFKFFPGLNRFSDLKYKLLRRPIPSYSSVEK